MNETELAIKLCEENGENPFSYIDYSDLRKGIQRYEYFMDEASNLLEMNDLIPEKKNTKVIDWI